MVALLSFFLGAAVSPAAPSGPLGPCALAPSPDGRLLYVTCALPHSTVVELDTAALAAVRSFPAGHTAGGPAVSPDGRTVVVANHLPADASVATIIGAAVSISDAESFKTATVRLPGGSIDAPTLIEVWRTAPYRHNGPFTTVKGLLVEGRHGASRGGIEGLTVAHIDDLVVFVLLL